MTVGSADVRRGDVIRGYASGTPWVEWSMVLAARWYSTHLSLDLLQLETGKVVTGCALSADDEFVVERYEHDPVIEASRVVFSDYCRRHGL